MKKLLLIALMAMGTFFVQAQTKGTNTLGLGVNVNTTKSEATGQVDNEQKNSFYNLGYGHFIKDNERIGINFTYGKAKNSGSEFYSNTAKSYGGNVTYQKYYSLIKKFYAFGGGRAGYSINNSDADNSNSGQSFKDNQYSIGAYGGVTWFVSKRFALEADLLSADVSYSKLKYNSAQQNGSASSRTTTNFNLTTAGAINNLGFKIYLLF
ncbi:MAG: hypothetical protein JWQ25_2051 [Daejeonella sp.]|nr:hypothetical protein [Daejeonella sp.]